MIVGTIVTDNRENEIAGAVQSVAAHVDLILLVDTGVTDRTVERAKETADLVVVKHAWVDFSTARNASIEAAEQLGASWIVIVDSDERINFGDLDFVSALAKTRADVLFVESDDGSYPKEKILRAGSGVRFFGPTHEALIGGTRELLRGVTFTELPKSDERMSRKLTRDVALLSEFVGLYPNDPRWHYYLGASFEGLGRRERAAEEFGECARLRKTGNEAAWSYFKQAEQLFLLERFEEAISAAARGMATDATFAECACVAAESALKLGRENQAIAWARIAEAVGRYKGCAPERLWFRDLPSLYEIPYEVLRSATSDESGRAEASRNYHAAKLARVRGIGRMGEYDLDRISVSRSAPSSNREEARSMRRPGTLRSLCPSATAVQIRFDPPGGRLPMNPSVCCHRGEIWCVVRAVNYSMKGREYVVHDPYGVVRSENYLGRISRSGEFFESTFIRDLDKSPRFPSHVVGYEDIRLVSVKGRRGDTLTGSATVCDRDPDGRRLIARLHFDGHGDVVEAQVQPSNQLNEKNWMPVSVDGSLTWIYSLDPTAILPGPLHDCPFALDHLRGGAAMKFGTGYLCVMHEVIEAEYSRIYLHRFVRLDKKFNVVAVSGTWIFSHYGIEFCAGVTRYGKDILLSYGIDDREAWIVRVNAKEVENMEWMYP